MLYHCCAFIVVTAYELNMPYPSNAICLGGVFEGRIEGYPLFHFQGRNPYTGKKRRTHLGEKKRSRAPKYKSSGHGSSSKGGDDDDHHSTVVLCSSKDELVLKQVRKEMGEDWV